MNPQPVVAKPENTVVTDHPDLAVIIVSWNVSDLLQDCLASLLQDLEQSAISAQIWVVDNASTDDSVVMVLHRFPQVRLIASKTNLGFAAGNNAALRAMEFPAADPTQPQGVLLLNPDTIVLPGALVAMLDLLKSQPEAGVVGANLTFGDSSFQHGAFHFPGLWQLAIELFPLPGRLYESRFNGRYSQALYEGSRPFLIDHPLGAAMLVRAAAIRQVGLLDEGYHMYVEEVDWSKRLRSAGWRAYCVPAAQIIHLGGQSTEQIKIDTFLSLWRSRYRFYQQHYGWLRRFLARQLVQWGMRRKSKSEPELTETFQTVQKIWQGQDV